MTARARMGLERVPALFELLWLSAFVLSVASGAARAQAHPEIVVGCDPSGRLVARFDAAVPFPLQPSRLPGIDGYADAMPGMASVYASAATADFRTLDPGADIVFALVGADAGAGVWNDHGTAPLRAGETFALGHPPFDSHPVWHLAPGTPAGAHALRLELRDTTGRYRASEVFAPTFAPDDASRTYGCPMACEGSGYSSAPGRCSVCGMALKLFSAKSYRVRVEPVSGTGEAGKLQAGRAAELLFRIEAPDGAPVTDLEVVHEKLVHLLLVSNDLSWFAHEHPERQADGSFRLSFAFPHGGPFTLYHDFTPAGVGMQVVPVELEVEGERPPPAALVAGGRRATAGDYAVELAAPASLRALSTQRLAFRVSRAGQPVTDLEPFLGAMGHLIVISQDRARFVHSHPLPTPGEPEHGPEVVFHALFPAAGTYKAWSQFQHRGQVITADFVIEILTPRGEHADPPAGAPR